MLRKEWHDLFRQSLFFIAGATMLPALLILFRIIPDLSYPQLFFPACQFLLFFWAFFLGASFLASERHQGGMTYLLTLPLSRLRLFQIKLLPRLTAVLAFFLLFYIIQLTWGEDLIALPLFAFAVIYFALFFVSLSLSASSENFLVLFFLSMFSLMAFLGINLLVVQAALKLRGYSLYELATADIISGDLDSYMIRFIPFVAAFLLLPALLSFVLTFRRLDVRPTRGFNKRFFRYLGPLFILALIVSVLSAYSGLNIGYRTFHLTRDHKLIESHVFSDLRIHDGTGVKKIENYGLSYADYIEINGMLYDECDDRIVRIDLFDFSSEVIYRCIPGRAIHTWLRHCDNSLIFLTRKHNYTAKQLEILNVDSGALAVIPLAPENSYLSSSHEIFVAGEVQGSRYWLMQVGRGSKGSRVVRIWEDGRTELIAESLKRPCYVNGMLLTYTADEILLSKEKEGRFETVQRIPNPSDYSFGTSFLYRQNLNNAFISELYGQKSAQQEETGRAFLFAKLDLESFTIQELDQLQNWPRFVGNGAHLCFEEEIDSGRPVLKVYRLQQGHLEHLRSFPGVSREDFEHRVDVFRGGLVIVQGKKVNVYAFPDLHELEFKKLR